MKSTLKTIIRNNLTTIGIYSFVILFFIVIDQVTKIYVHHNFRLGESVPVIENFFNLTYVRNTGAAFGFGGQYPDFFRYILFLALPVLMCAWLIKLIYMTLGKSTYLGMVYSLILSGAIGNLIDRFRLGFVIDFFDFYQGSWHFAAFNVADSCISVAAFFLVLDFLFFKHYKKIENQKNEEEKPNEQTSTNL